MAEVNDQNQNNNPNAGQDQNPPAGAKNTDNNNGQNNPTGQQEHMIPKSRFDEVNQKFKDVQSKLGELMAEREKADKKAKEQQGKYEELYKSANDELTKSKQEHQTVSTRVEQLEAVINNLLETRLNDIPEEFRDLVPSKLNPEAKLEWLATAEQKGLFKSVTQKKNEPVGESTNPSGSQTTNLNQLSPMQLLRAAYGQK